MISGDYVEEDGTENIVKMTVYPEMYLDEVLVI